MDSDKHSLTSDVSLSRKATPWVISLVVFPFLARIGHGLFISISGPTLLFIAENVDADITQVSAAYSLRSLGVLLGSVCFSFVANRFPNLKLLLSLGIGFAIMGLTSYATPFMVSLAGLTTMTMIGGLMFGYTDAGCQSLYLKLWGEEASRPYIQLTHFGFSVGAFLAPVIAKPFLEMANEESESDTDCPNFETLYTTVAYTVSPDNSTSSKGDDESHAGGNSLLLQVAQVAQRYKVYVISCTAIAAKLHGSFSPVTWCFIVIGTYVVITSVALFVMSFLNVEDKVKFRNIETTESREEEPIKDVWMLFLFGTCYYFCCETLELIFSSYIYSIALCSSLRFTVSDASLLNSLFWGGFGIGRGTAIFHSNYFHPSTIITYDLFGTTISLVFMSIFGEKIELMVWIATFYHGICCATLYSCGVSWMSQVTNVSGTYMFLFAFGNSIGAIVMLPVGGAMFEQDPFSVIYLLAGMSGANVVFFVIMNLIARQRKAAFHEADDKSEETIWTSL